MFECPRVQLNTYPATYNRNDFLKVDSFHLEKVLEVAENFSVRVVVA